MKRIYKPFLAISAGMLLFPALWFSMNVLATSGAWTTQTARQQSSATPAAKEPKTSSGSAKMIQPALRDAFNLRAAEAFNLTPMFAPTITLTKSATLGTDVNSNTFVNPGDTLMYSVVVSNTAVPGAGNDALNVVFSDQLNANLTLVGTATASPIATNDAYSVIGNVGITVPAANGLLSNDVNPQGTGTISVTTAPTMSAQGGNVTVAADGSFSYNPPPGHEGPDSFSYTITHNPNGKTDTGTVTLTVSGMIWFINNNAAACTTLAGGCGRLSNPFSTLAAFQALNDGIGNNPAANDNIFVYESATGYPGGVTLLSGQKLIGQDATASLATIAGVSVPSFSNALPATNSGNATVSNITGTVTLNSNTTARGFQINSTTSTGLTDPAGAITGVSVSEVSVSTTTATAVSLSSFGGTVSLISVSKNGGTNNGISLATTTGTFTVTGTGSAGSGGTLQNIVGADAVSLNTTSGLVTLDRMIIQDITASGDASDALQTHSGVDAIHGRTVNGGLTLANSTIQRISDNAINGTVDAVPVTASPTATTWSGLTITNCMFQHTNRFNVANFGDSTNESAVIIWGIKGTVSVTGSTFQNCSSGIDFRTDTSGTLDMTAQTNTFDTLYKEIGTNSVGRFGISVVQLGSTTSTVRVGDWQNETNAALGNTFTNGGNAAGIQIVADTGSTGNMKAEVAKNTLTVTDHSSPGQPPLNTIYNFPQSGVLYRTLGTGNFEGIFAANVFDQAMHANGGLGQLSLIAENGNSEFIVRNNTFGLPWDLPMEIRADGQSGGQSSCKIQVTGNTHIDGIVGNAMTDLGGQSPYGSSFVQVRNNGRMDLTMQNEATPLGLTDTSSATGSVSLFVQTTSNGDILNLFLQGLQGPRGYRLNQSGTNTFNLFRNGSAGGTPQLVLQDNNVRGGAGVDTTNPPAVTATGTITLTNTAPMLPSITPSFAPPISGEEQQAAPQQGGNNSVSLTTRLGQWLRPMFSAFAAPTNLSLKAIGNWFSPSASAAESNGVNNPTAAVADEPATAPQANTKAIPARTMIVNSRGETRIVPTASLAAMAGELITLPSSGSFTLPAGESTTIMFNAMIGSGFTGTAITNQASVSGSNFSMATSNNLSTPVIQAPNFSKAFSPTTIATNTGVSALTFTLVNPNPSQALSAVAFTDSLPAGVEVAATPMAATAGCGVATFAPAAAATTLNFSGGSIAAGGTCAVSVNVRSTTEGAKLNTSSTATSTQANPSGTASATLNVINAPTFTKAFGASTVQLNGSTSLTFTITNNSATSGLSGMSFTDALPAGLIVAAPSSGLTTTCNGSVGASPGSGSVTWTGGSLVATASCTISLNVTGTTTGAKNNSATLATTELGASSASTGTVTLTVLGPPTISKAFSPTSITVGGTSNVTLTLTNPNASALNNASFTDTLTNMSAVGGAVTGTCSGTTPNTLSAGATALSFSGITIPASSSCTVNFSVTSSTPGSHPNATSGVTTTQTPVAGTASNAVNLNVFAPPTITKSFSPTSVAVGGTSTLTLTITNPAGNPAGITGVAVSDTFPAGMEVHTTPGATNTCGGTFAPAAMATSISLTGGSIASAGGSCSVSVTVKATTGGAKLNTTGAVSSTEGGTGLTASATLSVAQAPTVMKSFSPPAQIPLDGISILTISFTNSNAFPLTSTAISDSFPAGMEVDATPGATNTCGGTFMPTAAATSISLSGGTIPASGSCAISVAVKGTTAGVKTNTTGNVSTAESGTGGTGTANLTVVGPPAFTKAFSPSSIPLGSTSTLNFTITNNNTTSALNGIGFTDVLPTGLSVSDATTNNVCGTGSVLTVTAATRTISLTGGNLAVGNPMPTTCTIPVTVTGIAAGAQLNTTQAITSTEGGTGSTATATLNVFAPPTIAKSFSPTGVQVGGTSTLTITITNPVANPAGVTGVAVSDTFPAGMEVHTTPGATNTCGGTFAPAAMATNISLTGGAIATAGGSCSISVTVKGTTGGAKLNTTGTVSSTQGGTGLTASATLTVAAAPTVAKSFSPSSIAVGGTSTLTLNFTNPNAFALNGLAISDSFPAGVQVAATPAATNTCGGTFAPAAGNTSISLSGGTLTSSGNCSISVAVTGTTAGAKLNTTGTVSSTESGAGLTANATLNVFAPPTLSKVFVPTSVALNGQSTLNIVITNPAANPGGLSGIAISDTFPAGLEVSSPLVSSNTCGGTFAPTAGATTISLTGGAIATAGNNCTISVNVRGTTAGAKLNTTGTVSSTEGGTGLTASATLNVFAPPTITKAFSPTTVAPNGTSTLTITITNPAANPAGVTGVAVSDTFPAGMEVHTTPGATNTCGGTFSPAAMATSISLTGGSIATAGGSCSISVTVKGTTAGVKNNVTGTVSSTEGGTGLTASATLTVAAPPTVAKAFSPTSVIVGGTSTLTINFTNPNSAIALTGLAISDSFPAGVEVAATPGATNTCGGTFAPTAAATSISLSGGSLAASGNCSISVSVRGTTAGAKLNTTGNVSSTESGAGLTANATLNVFAPPTITKAFSPTTVALNGISTLTITITNPAANPAGVNGVAVSDTFPAGLVVDTTPMAMNTCGGTFSPVANATNIALTGGTIASAGGSCAISVKVKGTTPGAKLNTTGAVSSTEGGTGLTASATLNVFAPPTVTKAFSPNSIQLNNTSTLTITITNPATNSGGVTGVAINDPFPAGLEVDAAPMATNTCGGTFAPAAAATSISLTGGAIATAGGSCSISVKVKGTTQGLKTNTTGAVSSTEGGTGLTATATLDVITCNSIVCPSNVFTATTGNSAVVNYPAPSANGICGTITCSPASGSAFNVGTTTVTCNSSIGNQSCSFNVTVNRVSGSISDPLICTGPGNTVQATLNIGNNGNVNQTVSNTTTFTNLVGVPNSCTVTPNVGTCVVTNGNLTYNGTLSPGQVVSITYLTQVSDLALTGAQVCTNNSVTFNGGTPFALSICDVVDCPAPGPGNPFPARSEASDQSAGSVLFYNVYTSSSSAPNLQNTRVSLTNVHPQLSSTVHLFFVDGASCSVADSYVCLTANQTTSFLMSDLDPGTTGYIVAVATDSRGCPINFNYLIGDEYVKFQSGHAANLGAQAYSAIPGGLPACDQNSVTATINFDGASYDRTARTLALDSLGSRADGNDTLLVLNRIGGNLGIGAATLGTLFGILYDDSENALSFNVTGSCQLRGSLTNNFPRTTPRFEQFIPAGRTGWMKFFSQSDIGITGAAINFNPNATSSAGAFNQGHNLHALTLSGAASYVIPVFPPAC